MDARDIFFYGLFMDADVLRGLGVEPGPGQRAHVDGFALRIGERATIEPCATGRVYGMVYALAPDAVRILYAQAGLLAYAPEGVLAWIEGAAPRPALTFRTPRAPRADERSDAYARSLQEVLARLGFPRDYVDSLAGTADID